MSDLPQFEGRVKLNLKEFLVKAVEYARRYADESVKEHYANITIDDFCVEDVEVGSEFGVGEQPIEIEWYLYEFRVSQSG